jgi:HAMP domain-containing protein
MSSQAVPAGQGSNPIAALSRRARGGLARTLLLVLLPLILLPLISFAVLIYQQVQANITRQVNAQLTSLASQKESQIHQWASARVADVNTLARSPDVLAAVRDYMADQGDHDWLTGRLHAWLVVNPSFEAAMLARPEDGVALVSTLNFRFDRFIGQSFVEGMELERVRRTQFLLPPRYEPRLADLMVLVVAPVVDPQQGTIGLLYGFVRDEQLQDIVAPSPGLGRTGRSHVVTADGYQLGNIVRAELASADSEGIRRARLDRMSGSGIYLDQNGQEVFGVYRWLPLYEMALLIESSTEEALAPLRQFATTLAGTALAAVAFSTLGVVVLTRRLLSQPLLALTDNAQRMASGDLMATVTMQRRDEIGVLAAAFNSMAAELRGLYQDLENKVEERTRQLEAAAEIGRAATSILSPEELMARSVDLIRERFGYYHVSIFLLDETGRSAVLAESTGEVGAQLKAGGHKLDVGSSSLIGWVTANRRPRVALDVGEDLTHFRNPLLPETRAEAALPLRVGERLIGALDVQSKTLNAFGTSDLEVLQVLADQLAVAIENGRLFAQQQETARLEQRVSDLTAKVHRALTVDAILQTAANELGQTFGANKVVVRLAPEAEAALTGAPATGAALEGPAGNGSAAGQPPQEHGSEN